MSFELKVFVFLAVSLGPIWLSRKLLLNWRSHGFYRFFAFESFMILVLLNIDYWFEKPFSLLQLISWFLFIITMFIVIHGLLLLRKIGKPNHKRQDQTLIGIEKTSQLVMIGAYRYIRHPIYSSLIYGSAGVFFKHPSWSSGLMAVITICFTTITAKIEEAENIRFFGENYRDYMKRTRMFIPYLF